MDSRAATILLGEHGEGTPFVIRYAGIKWKLCIRELSTERLIRISRELEKIGDIKLDDSGTAFHALMQYVEKARHIARAIAIATGTRWVRTVTRAIMGLSSAEQQTLFKIVKSYSDPDAFFFTMASAKRTSMMTMTTTTAKAG
jgi:hypothetical protein